MKKVFTLSIAVCVLCFTQVFAQCTSAINSGVTGNTVSTCGTSESISIAPTSWGTIGSLVNGWTYTVTSTNASYITIRQTNGTGTLIFAGNTALTFTSNYSGVAAVNTYSSACTNVWNGGSTTITYTITNPTASSVTYGGNNCGTVTLNRSGGNGTIEWQESTDGVTWNNTGNFNASYTVTSTNTNTYFRVLNSSGPCSVGSNIINLAAQSSPGPYTNGNLVISSNVTMGGNYVVNGDFTLNAGVTITEQAGCLLTITANNITINGTINGNARGNAGGSGGSGGNAGAVGGSSGGQPGTGGGAGSGTGAGTAGGNGTAGASRTIDCGFACIGGRDAIWGGGGAGGAGGGGSYGGSGGAGGFGAGGVTYTGFTPSSGGGAGGTQATYGNGSNTANIALGSGGGGAGGGGGGWQAGSGGATGGTGGGGVNLIANANLTIGSSAVINVNGQNGGNGGAGGANRYGGYDCAACPTGCCNESQCRDASLCGVCTYYTLGAEGGAGGGAGGGSGGGIKLQAFGATNIAGTLSANGGNGGGVSTPGPNQGGCFGSARAGGAGGGGRIKIILNPCQTNVFTATATVNAGAAGVATNGHTTGATGTAGTFVNNIQHPSFVAPTSGTIATNQTVNVGQQPSNLTQTAPTGGTNVYTYEWYQSTTDCGATFTSGSSTPPSGWTTTGLTSSTFPFNTGLCATTCYARRVRSGNCYEWTNRVTVTVSPLTAPTLAAVSNKSCNGFTINWNTISGANTYYVDIATDNAFTNFVNSNQFYSNFNAGNATSYPVTGLSSNTTYYIRVRSSNTTCSITSSSSATQTETTFTTPVAVAGANITTCTGTSAITLSGASASGNYSGTPTWSGGTGLGSFTQNANPALASFTPTVASGTFTATLTLTGANGCTNGTATRTITWGTQPTVTAGSNYSSCSGTTPIPMTGATATGTYSAATWSGGTLLGNWSQNINPALATFTPSVAAGSFTATITLTGSNGCANVTATKTIAWQTPVAGNTITAPTTTIFCGGGNPSSIIGSIAPTLNGGSSTYNFQWQEKVNTGAWANIGGATIADFDPPVLAADTHRYRRVVNSGLCADTSNIVAIIIEIPISNNSITNSGVASFCGSGNPANLVGSVPITPVGAFTYQWQSSVDNGQTWNDISLATAKDFNPPVITTTTSYRRRVRSSSCESFSNETTITIYPLATITSVAKVDVLCFNGNTGSITINVSGGTSPFQYSVNGGSTYSNNNTIGGLTAGNYNVVVMDANLCTVSYGSTITINQPALLVADADSLDASCANVFDGSITVIASGGVTPYSYSLNGGPNQPSNVFNNVAAGSYSILVTDFNNCTVSTSVVVNTQYTVTATLDSVKAVSCFGGTDGEVYVTLNGGITPYSYSINGITFQALPYFTGLTANNYVVSLRDSKGCTAFLNASVTQPALLTVLIDSVKNALCSGGTTGSIYISAGGGTAPYSYAWSNGTTNEDLLNVGANSYNVTITDSKGCTAVGGAAIAQPLPLFADVASFSDALCNGDSTGFVDISVAGGVPPYSFNWSNGTNAEDVLNVPSGTYSVTVTDNNGCSLTVSKTLTEPALLTSSILKTDILCNGGNTGSIDLSVTGGVQAYNYLWSNGATTQDLSGLGAGLYTVIITDANGCSTTNASTISQPGAISFTVSKTDVLCNGFTTGSITLTVNGGTTPINFTWSDGPTSQNRTALTAGTYTVSIVDANNCTATTTVVITEPAALILNETVTNVNCFGGNTGSIDINVNGGIFPYTYSWTTGATSQNVSGLSGGSYTVTVTDNNGCTLARTFNVTAPGAPIATTITGNNLTCFGDGTGSASVSVSGGTLPYSYLWNNFANTASINNLSGGKYTVLVTDANGCTARDTIILTEPAAIQLSTSVTNVLCNGDSGTINLTVTGGTPIITYNWSNGATTQNISDVAGTYTVNILDGNGCTATTSATITEPAALILNETVTDVNCFGGNTGSIDITVNGGVFPYTYSWTTGATTQNVSGLSGGSYTVTVIDNNGCTLVRTFNINSPNAAIATTMTGTNLTCFGDGNGSASVSVSGGTLPYSYLWNTFANTSSINNLNGGKYTVIVTDANGCTARDTIIIVEPAALQLNTVVTNVLCNGDSGTIALTVIGGTPIITYLWSNGATTQNISDVAGTYTVNVVDGNGCTATTSATITQPAAIVVNAVTQDVNCNGAADGSITLSVFGGVGPYSYNWSNNATTKDVTNLSGGTYTVTVTDVNGCTNVSFYVIDEPTSITSGIVKTDVTCPGAADGSATLTVNGGTPPYIFSWSNFTITQNANNLSGGKYFVIIRDKNNCELRDSVEILEPAPIVITGTVTDVSCNGLSDGSVTVNVTGGTAPYGYLWSSGGGSATESGLVAGTYTVTVTDINNCTQTASFTVEQPLLLSLTGIEIEANCFGSSTGKVDVTVVGGTIPYNFLWSNSATTEDLNNVLAGTYSLIVTDAGGCTAVDTFTVTEPTPIVSSVAVTNVTCFGANNGAANLTVSGGTAPYSFLWSNFKGSEDIVNLNGGLYIVLITDNRGCVQRDSADVFEPLPLSLTTVVNQITCFNNNDGTIDLSVSGGTVPYTYDWSNGATTQDISQLAGNTYAVTVTDAQNCTASISATIINPSVLNINALVKAPRCSGESNGSIDLIVSGGTPAYNYAWNSGQQVEDLFNIPSGEYIITVTDSKGCTARDTVDVSQPLPLYTTGFITDVSCNGYADGFVDITAYGGTLPYFFEWNTGPVTEDLGTLDGGAYTVTVADGNGCTVSAVYNVFEPQKLLVTLQKADAICNGSNTATVTPTVTGGVYPYQYLWSNFRIDSVQQNVGAGFYSVVVLDKNNCRAVDTILVGEPTAISITGVVTDARCKGVANGAVDITVSGGTGTYTYAWSNSTTNENLANAATGSYTVTVTDANGCIKTATFEVGEQQQLFVSVASIASVTCNGGGNGAVDITVAGGTLPYSYTWSNASTFEDVLDLKAGAYTVTVTDGNGCIGNASATVPEPNPIVVTTSAVASKCAASATGKVSAIVTGGTAPFVYTLNGITQPSDSFNGLLPGTYTLLVRDAKYCEAVTTFTIASPNDLLVDLTADKLVILSGMEVQLTASTTSTKNIVRHYWSPLSDFSFTDCGGSANCATPTAAPKITTILMVTVMDEDSCTASDTVRVEVINQPSSFMPTAFTPNGDGLNDRFVFDILGAETAAVKVFDRWGNLLYDNPAQANGLDNLDSWDGTFKGSKVEYDTYVYILKVKYFDGAEKDVTGTIAVMR